MPEPYHQDDQVTVYAGDCLDVLAEMPDASVDAVVTDPPYGLEFMGKNWDRPWAVSPTNTTGYTGRGDFTLPSHRDNRNANCRGCGGRQRGKNRCECAAPQWWIRNGRRQFVAPNGPTGRKVVAAVCEAMGWEKP